MNEQMETETYTHRIKLTKTTTTSPLSISYHSTIYLNIYDLLQFRVIYVVLSELANRWVHSTLLMLTMMQFLFNIIIMARSVELKEKEIEVWVITK